jgi:hypothetical protein
VTDPPEDFPCETIKDRLCEHHQLTEFQQVEKLHALEALGGSKQDKNTLILDTSPVFKIYEKPYTL